MEKNHALSVAVGVGAVGTALAYLGYSYYSKEKNTVNLTENHEQQTAWWKSIFENSKIFIRFTIYSYFYKQFMVSTQGWVCDKLS